MSQPQPVVLVQREGKVGIITLNRPEVMNAINAQLRAELDAAVRELDEDPNIHVTVVTGAGNHAFCAGADIREMVQREQASETQASGDWQSSALRLLFSAKPSIAAINGVAIGGGAHLASAADMRIGCERSLFRFPGAAYGRINATWMLPLIVGLPRAKELLFSARPIEAQEALSIGLLNRLVPSDRLTEETLRLAQAIATNPPEMVQAVKQLIHDYIGMRLPEMPKLEQETREKRLVIPPASDVFKDFLDKRGN